MKSKKIKHRTAAEETTLDITLKVALWGLLITVGISFALLLIGAAAAFFTGDPTSLVDPVGYVALFMSAFFGGFACSKLNRRAPYLSSVICGGCFVILSMLLSFLLPHQLASGMKIWSRLGLHALSLLTFPVGAFAGVRSASTNKRSKRRKRR